SGESQRSIAHRLEVSRQTVKKYCEGQTMPGVRKEYTRIPSVVFSFSGGDKLDFFNVCKTTIIVNNP
ncbi:MAG: helix-turn-helix transcriptional regulator, partial [Oscillospiraceae bacterium]|nr:helix-turn-helix transcriptional regulator [Oscillospiraceae bacterium]